MKKTLENLMPADDTLRRRIAIAVTVAIAGLTTLWGIYGIGQYGIALFIFTPLFIGACPVVLYGIKKEITRKEAFKLAILSLIVYATGLLAFAIEGLICIAMATPIGLLLVWLGSLLGHALVKRTPNNAPSAMFFFFLAIPATAWMEQGHKPLPAPVVTAIDIQASPEAVWKNVVEFPELEEPDEFIFKTGIAYPINATIQGSGVGAVRNCNFTTGSFVEPITVWDEPRLLRFDVLEQPEPMKELSFWDVNAPHLHDYFVSKQGQFRITPLSNGHTLLEGTTWYYHNIKPNWYWRIWSNHIIHKIHYRVLSHIKKNAEEEAKSGSARIR